VVEVKVKTSERIALIDITADVNRVVAESGKREGLCNLFVPHTTASIVISENWDPDVPSDMLRQLERIVPREAGYRHAEGNSQAHILSAMLSTSINVPIHEGKLAIGRWQGVMLAEFDGPRQRSVYVTVVAG
jgi:secondary thiamine-phosphate synthase enzyme